MWCALHSLSHKTKITVRGSLILWLLFLLAHQYFRIIELLCNSKLALHQVHDASGTNLFYLAPSLSPPPLSPPLPPPLFSSSPHLQGRLLWTSLIPPLLPLLPRSEHVSRHSSGLKLDTPLLVVLLHPSATAHTAHTHTHVLFSG